MDHRDRSKFVKHSESTANNVQSAPVQRVTGIGLLGGIGAAAATAGAFLSTPLLIGGAAVAGGALAAKYFRGSPSTDAPEGKKELNDEQKSDLEQYRRNNQVNPLSVKWDAAFTDEVGGRRRDKNAYRQWQIGRADDHGRPLGKSGNPLPEGRYMYVVTASNEFRYLPMKDIKGHQEQQRTHSQLSGKQNVYAAGAFNVNDQHRITSIDNESGHYQPPRIENAEYAKKLLTHLGVTGDIQTSAHDDTNDPKGLAYLKSQVKANARALRTWLPQKGDTGYRHGFAEPSEDLKKDMPF